MSTWTAEIAGSEKTFEAWGLGRARRRLISQGVDRFDFAAEALAFDADPVAPVDASVTIRKDGVTIFQGLVSQIPRFASGSVEGQRYVVSNAWAQLDQLVYQQNWYLQVDPEHPSESLVGGLQSRVILFQGVNGSKVSVGQQIADAIEYAASCGVAIQAAPDLVGNFPMTPPFDEGLDMMCGEVIKKALKWAPDAVTWFDYTTTPPTLHAARRAQLQAVSVSVVGAPLASLQLDPRHDLVAPSVVLKYERINTVDGISWRQVIRDVYPEGGSEKVPGTLVATIDLEGATVSHSSATIVCRPFQPASIDWWKAREATFRDWNVTVTKLSENFVLTNGDGIDMGPLYPDGSTEWEGWTNEVVKGQIAPWMLGPGKLAKTIQVQTRCDFECQKAEAVVSQTKNVVHDKPLTARVTVTNLASGTYTTQDTVIVAEDVPVGLAQQLFEAVGVLHYEGALMLVGEEIPEVVSLGQVLNLSGGRPEWTTAKALVQEVDDDIDSGTRSVRFGPPSHLGPADLIELLRFNRQRRVSMGYASRSSGQGSGSGEASLGEVTANHDSGSGSSGVPSVLSVAEFGGVDPMQNPELQDIARSVKIDPADLVTNLPGVGNQAKFRRFVFTCGGIERDLVVLCQDLGEV